MQNFILYHATGKGVNECRYALLKLLAVYNLKPPTEMAVVIFTDQPAVFDVFSPYFQRFEIIEELDSNILKDYQGIIKRYSGNFLFLDTGGYPVKPLESVFYAIANGTLYSMPLDKTYIAPWQKQTQEKPVTYKGTRLQFTDNLRYWNAEVLGLSNKHVHLVDNAIELDGLLKQSGTYPAHTSMAMSYVLQEETMASLADSLITYDNLQEISELLEVFFTRNEEESIPNLVKLVQQIDVVKIRQHKVQYLKQPFYKKWIDRIRGKSWSIKQYEKKF